MDWRRVREEYIGENIRRKFLPKLLVLKARGTEFHKFLQSMRFKVWSFKGVLKVNLVGIEPEGTPVLFLGRRQKNHLGIDSLETVI